MKKLTGMVIGQEHLNMREGDNMETPLEYYMNRKGVASIKELSDDEMRVLLAMCDYVTGFLIEKLTDSFLNETKNK